MRVKNIHTYFDDKSKIYMKGVLNICKTPHTKRL